MLKSFYLGVTLAVTPGFSHVCFSEELCKALAKADVPQIENNENILRKGTYLNNVTLFGRINTIHSNMLCQRIGYCFPTKVLMMEIGGEKIKNGMEVDALEMVNCHKGPQTLRTEQYTYYSAQINTSKVTIINQDTPKGGHVIVLP